MYLCSFFLNKAVNCFLLLMFGFMKTVFTKLSPLCVIFS